MPGAGAPAAARGVVVSTRVSHHEYAGNTRHSLRNGFNGFLRALPGDRACLPPSSTDCSANLTPASGRQDHTTSPSASASPVKRASASTASRPASVTSRAAPLSGTGWRGYRFESGPARSGIFLREGLDRELGDLPVGLITLSAPTKNGLRVPATRRKLGEAIPDIVRRRGKRINGSETNGQPILYRRTRGLSRGGAPLCREGDHALRP